MDLQALTYIMQVVFMLSFAIVVYTYIGYAVLLALLVQLKKIFKKQKSPIQTEPSVTIIIAAYNEEEWIRAKLENTLAIAYPGNKMQVIVNTEGSTDQTAFIARSFPEVEVIDGTERIGKISSLNRSVRQARGEILLFTDANSLVREDMLTRVVDHFSLPEVGGVAGEKKILTSFYSNGTEGEGFYWKYESYLKKLDSDFYSTVGAAGELFAMRKELWEDLPANTIIEDFVQSLKVCAKGYVVRYEPLAIAYETPSLNLGHEMKRKVRICAGGFQAMGMLRELFNIFRYPLLSFQFISHRILRWSLTPLALVLMLVSNIIIVSIHPTAFYLFMLTGQLLLYACAFIGWQLSKARKSIRIFTIPFYFVFMNVSVFLGFALFRQKVQTVLWEKSSRQKAAPL